MAARLMLARIGWAMTVLVCGVMVSSLANPKLLPPVVEVRAGGVGTTPPARLSANRFYQITARAQNEIARSDVVCYLVFVYRR